MENGVISDISNDSNDTILLDEITEDLVNADNIARDLSQAAQTIVAVDGVDADLTPQITTEEKDESAPLIPEQKPSLTKNTDTKELSIQNKLEKPKQVIREITTQQQQFAVEDSLTLQPTSLKIEKEVAGQNNTSLAPTELSRKPILPNEVSKKDDKQKQLQPPQQSYDFEALEKRLDNIAKNLPPIPSKENSTSNLNTTARATDVRTPQPTKDIVNNNKVEERAAVSTSQTSQTSQPQKIKETQQGENSNASVPKLQNTSTAVSQAQSNKPQQQLPAPTPAITENNITVLKETNSETSFTTNNTTANTTVREPSSNLQPAASKKTSNVSMPDATGLSERLKKELAHLPEPPSIFEAGDINVSKAGLEPFSEKQDNLIVNQPTSKENNQPTSVQPNTNVESINSAITNNNVTVNNKELPKWVTDPIKKPGDTKSSKPPQSTQPVAVANTRRAPNDITSKSYRTIFNTINNLPPELEVFNLKSSIERGIREVSTPSGGQQALDNLLNNFPTGRKTISPTPQQVTPAREPRLSFNNPYQSYNVSGTRNQSTASNIGANEKTLIKVNKNLDLLSTKVQQTYQLLSTSMQALNNTAVEILRIMPTLAAGNSREIAQGSQRSRSSFTPTESKSLIGTYRNGLNLTPRTYVNSPALPGNGIS